MLAIIFLIYNFLGALLPMCFKNTTTSQDGTADVCTLKDLTAGVWVNETLMIVYETNTTMKDIIIKWGKNKATFSYVCLRKKNTYVCLRKKNSSLKISSFCLNKF